MQSLPSASVNVGVVDQRDGQSSEGASHSRKLTSFLEALGEIVPTDSASSGKCLQTFSKSRDTIGDEHCAVHTPRAPAARQFIPRKEEAIVTKAPPCASAENKVSEMLNAVEQRLTKSLLQQCHAMVERQFSIILQRLEKLEQRREDIMPGIEEAAKRDSMEPRELQNRIDTCIQNHIEEHWLINADAMKQQIQYLKSAVEEHTCSLAQLQRVADTEKTIIDSIETSIQEDEAKIAEDAGRIDVIESRDPELARSPSSCSMRASRLATVADAPRQYKLANSVWEASLLAWSPAMNAPASIIMTLLFLTNLCFLIVLSGTILHNFTTSDYDVRAIEQLRAFRETAGHQIDTLDPISQASLASRLCAHDMSLAMATDQLQRVQILEAYLGPLGEDPDFWTILVRGPIMCLMALAVWFMTLVKETDNTWNFARAFRLVPAAMRTKITILDGEMTLDTVYPARKAFVLLTVFIRISLVGYLGYAGARYMINTVSLQELLLNCVALEIVLEIDEMLFEALSPGLVRHVMDSLKPLPMKQLPHLSYIDAKDISLIILFITALIIFPARYLTPTLKTLKEAQQALCGGELEFVYLKDELGLVVVAPSQEVLSRSEYESGAPISYARRVVRSIVAVDGDLPTYRADHAAFMARGLFQALEFKQRLKATDSGYLASVDVDDFAGARDMEGSDSSDALDGSGRRRRRHPSIIRFLRDALQDSNIQSCAEVELHCHDFHRFNSCKSRNGSRCRQAFFSREVRIARAFCPQTCGCVSPASGTIWKNLPGRGCSSTSQSSLQYQMELKELNPNCSDLDHRYLSFPDFRLVAQGKPIGTCANHSNFALPLLDICRQTSFSSICPQTCQCSTMIIPHMGCPSSCLRANQTATIDHRQAKER